MTRRFTKLTRPAVRQLKSGESITEHGMTAACLASGDIRYSVNVMVDGQRIHRVIGRESDGVTRTQAEDFIEVKRTEAREGRLSLPKGRKLALTFEGAADLYLRKLREVGGKDYDNNETHLRRHLVPYLGKMRLDQISVFTLQKFRRHCIDKGLTESTANLILATYRRMSRKLAEWNILAIAMPMIRLNTQDNRRTYVISDDEEAQLLDASLSDSNSFVWLFIKLGMATSLRHNEMLTARFEHFDAKRRRLRVTVKGGKRRSQPLTRGITEILEHEREMAADPDGWIFPNPGARSGHIQKMNGAFARCVERAGMDTEFVTPHVMRHTAITRLAETGVDIRTLQEFSGHETMVMVMRYTHAQDRAIDRALDILEGRTVSEQPRVRRPANS